MSFGKVKEAVRALEAEGKLPPHLRAGERDKRIFDRLVELGYDPRTELPSRRSLARYLERLTVADATRPICPNCHVHVTNAGGIVGSDASEPTGEGHDMHFSNPRTMIDQTGASRPWEQEVPWDHGIDEVLDPAYFNPNYLQFRERDRVQINASDFSWTIQFLVVSVNRSARTVSTLLLQPPMFLLRSSDRSDLYLMDAFQKLENAFRENKMSRAEYESRMEVLQSLRDHGRYPSAWLAAKLVELARALDAGRLTRQQHANAAQGLFDVMSEDQAAEVNNIMHGGPKAAVAAASTSSLLSLVPDEAKPRNAAEQPDTVTT